jgi:hypothetical protein
MYSLQQPSGRLVSQFRLSHCLALDTCDGHGDNRVTPLTGEAAMTCRPDFVNHEASRRESLRA